MTGPHNTPPTQPPAASSTSEPQLHPIASSPPSAYGRAQQQQEHIPNFTPEQGGALLFLGGVADGIVAKADPHPNTREAVAATTPMGVSHYKPVLAAGRWIALEVTLADSGKEAIDLLMTAYIRSPLSQSLRGG